ncbi:MAG: hypothetical protein SFU86_25895 [Pirellulaceae bacterium]|nr:hypothetical protein [Pirellulaceae bacterium]
MLAYVAKFSSSQLFGYALNLDEAITPLQENYSQCDLQSMWLGQEVTYWQDEETFIEVEKTCGFIYAVARDPRAAHRLTQTLGTALIDWERPSSG